MLFRIIPTLLVKNNILYKGKNFKNHNYVGDPINAVKIFNEKEVDELVVFDISVTNENKDLEYDFLVDIASECFIPLTYGGGIKNLKQIEKLLYCGIEKVCINTAAFYDENFIIEASKEFGSSTIMVSVDIYKSFFKKIKIVTNSGKVFHNVKLFDYLKRIESNGAGEVLINDINREGTYKGFDYNFISNISQTLNVPMIISGGASSLKDFKAAIKCGASAVAAGSFFTFQGKHKAVLITYPDRPILDRLFIDLNE